MRIDKAPGIRLLTHSAAPRPQCNAGDQESLLANVVNHVEGSIEVCGGYESPMPFSASSLLAFSFFVKCVNPMPRRT